MFNIYINKAAELYGVARTRQIYEKAIEVLPEDTSRDMCLRFSDMETKLGEIDRARVIYAHCSQMCDPRVSRFEEERDHSITTPVKRFRSRQNSGKLGKTLKSDTATRTL